MEGYFTFQWCSRGEGQIGGGCRMGGISFDVGRGFEKNRWMGGGAPMHPPEWETLKPSIKKGLLKEMEGVNDNASAFMHQNIEINK